MMRHTDRQMGTPWIYTAAEETCAWCGNPVPICQVISRPVQGLDEQFMLVRRDRQCGRRDCTGPRPYFYAPRDIRPVLPKRIYGLDVTLHIGERHLREGVALAQVTRDLNVRGVPVDQRHTGRIFRDFLALASLERGDDAALRDRLRAQGGIVMMCDGVQFDERSPVLYVVWDARSGTPLFGERKPYRGEEDLVPLLERVRRMDVPVIGVVTDKETGLVPAVKHVFPDVPYQFCHTHFLMNCAKPIKSDVAALRASVRRRADAVRQIVKHLEPPTAAATPQFIEQGTPDAELVPESTRNDRDALPPASDSPSELSEPTVEAAGTSGGPSALLNDLSQTDGAIAKPLTEADFAREVGDLVRVNSRVSGKAPLNPAELARHDRLAEIRTLVHDAKKNPASRSNTATGL